MIGKDLIKYHNYIHGPVHYTDSLEEFPLADWGINPMDFTGSALDPAASKLQPFQGHMFINGCVSATGWLNDSGACLQLATSPIVGCRGTKICGDHMQGRLHFSHQTLTRFAKLSSYDFRNAEMSFALNKDTFKTIVCDAKTSYAKALHIGPSSINPGCVSTLKIVVPPDSPMSHVKLAFHPDLVWLTPRPIYVLKGFIAIISFESYGTRTRDVICSHREQCFEVCKRWGVCSLSGEGGFETEDGHEDSLPPIDPQTPEPLSGCHYPLEFKAWEHVCGDTYNYSLSTQTLSAIYMYDFRDYYAEDGGTRLWNISKTINPETNELDKEWYDTGPQANMFKVKILPNRVPGYSAPPLPILQIYKGSYSSMYSQPKTSDLIYDSSLPEDPEHEWVTFLPGEDSYAVKFTRTGGVQYLIKLVLPPDHPYLPGKIKVSCPFKYIAYRYVPRL